MPSRLELGRPAGVVSNRTEIDLGAEPQISAVRLMLLNIKRTYENHAAMAQLTSRKPVRSMNRNQNTYLFRYDQAIVASTGWHLSQQIWLPATKVNEALGGHLGPPFQAPGHRGAASNPHSLYTATKSLVLSALRPIIQ